jgi:LPXTG-motif cell wall-anchored protein
MRTGRRGEANVGDAAVDVRLVVPPGEQTPESPVPTATPGVDQPTATPGMPLPRTGADLLAVVLVAAVLLLLGHLLLVSARRRSS